MNNFRNGSDRNGSAKNSSEIDWNDVWVRTFALQTKNEQKHTSKWEDKKTAENFWKRSQKNTKSTDDTISELPIMPESSVLDIGSGPGRLSIPIAKRVKRLTAVEPAEGMRNVLIENLKSENIENVDIVSKNWEDIDPSDLSTPYDLSIAAFSLAVTDIKAAIEKIESVTSGYVFVYWFCGLSPWDKHSIELWERLYDEEYIVGPKSNVIYNVLYDMGIYPDMRVFELDNSVYFDTFDDALTHFKFNYKIPDESEDILKNYLKEKLIFENGKYTDLGKSTRVRISWKVEK
ncbi:MAG: class I SAM-dependent methyltransferase [Methanosarcinaceae archaeon]|nr:class I SAM-dependent methyltransferase [Methanosarcinaceae archaeon]